MRPFLIGALCATLIGCSCPLPPRGVVQTCTSQGCFTRTAASRIDDLIQIPKIHDVADAPREDSSTTPIEPKRAPFRPEPAVKPKKVAIAAKPTAARPQNEAGPVEGKPNSRTIMESEVPPSAQPSATPDPAPKKATTTIGGKTEGPVTGQPSETSDPVLKKAKITVAAKMENPLSAEFVDMKRATRENTSGQPVEVICGHVKGKKKSGEATGERPFLYLVTGDEAYIVGSNPDSLEAIVYRAHCTSPNSH